MAVTESNPPGVSLGELAPLENALDKEIVRLERRVAGALRLLSGAGFLLSVYVGAVVARNTGLALALLCAVLVAWFSLTRVLLKRGVAVKLFHWLSPIVEVSLPTVIVVIDCSTLGPQYATSISVPLQFYAMLTALQVLRLRRWVPIVCGLIAAIEYLVVYSTLLYPGLTAAEAAEPVMRPAMAVIRAVIIVLSGLAATLVTSALRRAVGTANANTRSQELFGKYRLQGELASGGMGIVYRALYCPEGGFKRPVALKRVHTHLARAEEFVTAFRAEAELCSRLVHPNVVQVLDFGRIEDTYFFAMEFVDGLTLAELISRARQAKRWVPPRVVAYVGRELLNGLHFAHRLVRDDAGERLRVVHRDLNPPNVLLSHAGEVKITDFGIARAIGKARQLQTQSATAGKAPYLSPEQARGEDIDERADLFAAGIILWEALCLAHLFYRENDMASARAVVFDAVAAPSTKRDDLNPMWDAFFTKALEKDAGKRFQSALEMRRALDSIIGEDTPRAEELHEFIDGVMSHALPVASLAEAPTRSGGRVVA